MDMAETNPEPNATASTSAATPLAFPVRGAQQNINSITLSGHARAHIGDVLTFELPEDVSKKIDSLRDAITSTEAACKAVHRALTTSRTAGEQLLDIAGWPQDIYHTLGTLRSSLQDEDTSDGTLWAMQWENTEDLLAACQATMASIDQRVSAVEGQGIEPKASEPRVMSMEELQITQSTLRSQKIKLSTVISMIRLYQTMTTQEVVDSFKEQLTAVLEMIEDEKAQNLPKALPHYDLERSAIPVELNWTLKRYEAETTSLLTEAVKRTDPSIQVSSYLDKETLNTAFWTCRTSAQTSHTTTMKDFMPLFITGLPLKTLKTVNIGVDQDDTVAEVRDAILRRLGLDGADFGFVHANRVLTDVNSTIREYAIDSNSTLHCVSFRPNRVGPGPWAPTYNLTILASDGTRVTLQLNSGVQYHERQIREAFTIHYNRARSPKPTAVSKDDVTLLSREQGDLSGRWIGRLSRMPGESMPETPVISDTTLIAWVATSRQARERFRRQLRTSGARGRFKAQLSTMLEDGSIPQDLSDEEEEDDPELRAHKAELRAQAGTIRPRAQPFRPGWILSKGFLASWTMSRRSRRPR